MSWFDSKKLQTYAKSTLLQAQKQIDKVLDIKEDEILAQSSTTLTKPALESKASDKSEQDQFFSNFFTQSEETKKF